MVAIMMWYTNTIRLLFLTQPAVSKSHQDESSLRAHSRITVGMGHPYEIVVIRSSFSESRVSHVANTYRHVHMTERVTDTMSFSSTVQYSFSSQNLRQSPMDMSIRTLLLPATYQFIAQLRASLTRFHRSQISESSTVSTPSSNALPCQGLPPIHSHPR
jgi:hypothetical protein